MRTTPLYETARDRGARFGAEGEWQVPASFAAVGEAEAAHAGVGVADVSHWGHFTLGGKDGVRFLQGLVTNDVAALTPGNGCYAAFLNVHGRIESDCHLFSFGDELVIQTPPERSDWVGASLGRFRLAGDFRLTPLAETHAALTVQGPLAARALERALGAEIGPFGPLECREVGHDEGPIRLLGVRRSTEWGADVLGPAAAVGALYAALLDGGAAPLGTAALDLLRMEAGIPRYGRDFDSDTVLQEVDVPEIVSFNKGCYLGQEVVARLHYLGKPSKLLRRLVVEGDALPAAGDDVVSASDDAQAAGRVTSVAVSPTLGPIVFAVVKRKFYAPGTPLRVRHDGALVGAVVEERVPAGEGGR